MVAGDVAPIITLADPDGLRFNNSGLIETSGFTVSNQVKIESSKFYPGALLLADNPPGITPR